MRWLRPDFQQRQTDTQRSLELPDEETDDAEPGEKPARKGKRPRGAKLPHPGPLPGGEGGKKAPAGKKVAKIAWPASRVERTRAVQEALARAARPVTVDELAGSFSRANKQQLAEILEALTALGLAKSVRGKFSS